ncbi:uncharacterized protein LOC132265020 [Phlebotomus argentipes]|uniref:uncharacterized protein LOC132265020 n=1 Tax=Phlebotomus argentipes TaxID=94469 RepID=UPI002892CAFC|nr:uncharacterized protein LOC132265020 [Phlebotomus argentipes]
MVDKDQLNTCIINLRGNVGKAKTRTIHKLTRKIKSFEVGKKKNPENKKLTTKIQKFVEEIAVLKKIDQVDNVKKIFSYSGKPESTMANVNATPLDRAIAKLIYNNEFLRNIIKKNKEALNLKDDDAEWKEKLLTMGKKKQAQQKKISKMNEQSLRSAKKKGKKDLEDTPVKQNDEDAKTASPKQPKKPKKQLKKERKDSGGDDEGESPKFTIKQKKQDKSDKVLHMNAKSKKIQKAKAGPKKAWNGNAKPPKPQFSGKAPGKPDKPFKKGVDKEKKTNGAVHPSWEAKKKQKATIGKFEGKKKKFQD